MKKKISILTFLLISWGINAQFLADFTSNETFGCAPLVIKFTDGSSPDATGWTWSSTAGVSSSIKSPTLVFSEPGNFNVTLESTNGAETSTKTILIRVSPGITADFTSSKTEGCVPFSSQFIDLSVPQSTAIISWFWSFSNGTTSDEQNPIVTFNDADKYNVLLKIADDNGCEAFVSKSEFIIGGGPIADFSFDSIACQIPADVSFINTSTGENLTYEWGFGNGSSANTETPPNQTYSTYDTVPVTLYVKESKTSCTDSVEKMMYTRKYEAKMEVTATCDALGFSVLLKDQTSPDPSSIVWDLGDGTQNIGNEFTHTYSGLSPRTITLTAKNGESCVNTKTLNYLPPKADFSFTAENTCKFPYEIEFKNTSVGTGLFYSWDYGDSSVVDTSFENNHSYVVPPIVRNPILNVVDTFGCEATTTSRVEVPIPIADFYSENEKQTGCAPLTITFADLTKKGLSPIIDVIWNYGDPGSGILNNGKDSLSSHTFNEPGKYDITLIVFLENGCSDTIVKKEFILVGELSDNADFNVNFSDTICYGETLSFEGLSTYSDSTYVSDYFCWAFEKDESLLLLNNETPPLECPKSPENFLPTDTFVHAQIPTHEYSNYTYKNGSSVSGYNYLGEIVPVDSTLHTHLIVGFHGCYQEVVKPIHVIPTAAMVGFAFYDFDFNLIECDSSKTIGIYNASQNYDSLLYFRIVYLPTLDTIKDIPEFDTLFYTFNKPGDYSIQIGVFNKNTLCKNEVSRNFHVVYKTMKINLPGPTCSNKEITAIDESVYSTGYLSRRLWSVEGNITSANFFPSITNDSLKTAVSDTGWNLYTLDVHLRVKDNLLAVGSSSVECSYSYSDSLYIEGTLLSMNLDTSKACAGDSVLFTNTSIGTSGIQSVQWFLKDSTEVLNTDNSFKTAYDIPKKYFHTLAVTSRFGCIDSLNSDELLVSIPILDFVANDTVVCKGDSVIFTNKSFGNNLINTWEIESEIYSNIDATHTFFNVNSFDVKLHAIDQYGCQDSAVFQNYIRVADLPVTDFYSIDIDVSCPPAITQFVDLRMSPATEWQWSISDGGKSSTQDLLHTFITAGTFDVEFTTTNKDGCISRLKKADYITVTGPYASVSVDTTAICLPDSVTFDMNMTDVAFYVWDFNDGTIQSAAVSSNNESITHNYSKLGIRNPIYTIIDTNNCIVVMPNVPSIAVDSLNANMGDPAMVSCDLDSVHFINNSSSYFQSTYTWDFGDGNTSDDSLGVNKYQNQDTFNVKLMMISSFGCRDTGNIKYTLFAAPKQVLTVINPYFCVPTSTILELEYNTPGFEPDEVYFTLENNRITGDSIELMFTEAKGYNLSYHIKYGAGNCAIDSSFSHEYFELPEASFDYNPENLSLDISEIFFSSNSANSSIWKWDFGDGNTKYIEKPVHRYVDANKYIVQLIASNEGGCSDTTSVEIPVSPSDTILLPNAFTPDGDGYNDEFGILYAGKMDILSFRIFNRWGNLVFRTEDITQKWNGIYKDKPQNHGTYVYYVKGRNEQGNILEYKGNFSLIR
jgi:gliding motility-associated-like protein